MPRTKVGAQLGPVVKAARLTIGWSQAELARRTNMSQAWVCRVELGTAGGLTLEKLDRLLDELGIRVDVAPEGVNLHERRLQREPAHGFGLGYLAKQLTRGGWEVDAEVEIGEGRYRGWIDLLAWHPETRTLLIVEFKTELRDLGATQRQLGWYEREAWAAATRRWGRPRAVRSALVLLATDANDAALRDVREAVQRWAPKDAVDLLAFIADPRARHLGRFVALADPLSRRHDWLLRPRCQGRRSRLADADYAGFMARRRRRAA